MFKKLIKIIKSAFGDSKGFEEAIDSDYEQSLDLPKKTNNNLLHTKQVKLFMGLLVAIVIILGVLINYIQDKVVSAKAVIAPEELKVETADKALDPDTMWRNHHEEELKKKTDELNKRILQAEASVEETKEKLIKDTQSEVQVLMEQLNAAKAEIQEANYNLREASANEKERMNEAPAYSSPSLEAEDFGGEIEFDVPKSAKDYVPEGTYFTGYLLGGLVVSTALSTPDENAVPLTIILKSRGNLAKENEVDISQCKIRGSAYGDLSSERAVIRLEKMTCYQDGMYITSDIAGDIHGPDGFNGIKGTVISTSSKHLKNAAIGGLLSGLASSAKGTKGFFIGEVGMHRKIRAARNDSKTKAITRPVNNKETINNGSDDGWK